MYTVYYPKIRRKDCFIDLLNTGPTTKNVARLITVTLFLISQEFQVCGGRVLFIVCIGLHVPGQTCKVLVVQKGDPAPEPLSPPSQNSTTFSTRSPSHVGPRRHRSRPVRRSRLQNRRKEVCRRICRSRREVLSLAPERVTRLMTLQ